MLWASGWANTGAPSSPLHSRLALHALQDLPLVRHKRGGGGCTLEAQGAACSEGECLPVIWFLGALSVISMTKE